MKRWLITRPQWIYSVIVTLIVLYLTMLPQPLPETDIDFFPDADKLVHAIMFYGVAMTWAFDLKRHDGGRRLSTYTLVLISLAATLFGGVIEIVQGTLIPGRSGDMPDFIYDAVGAMFLLVSRPVLAWFFR